MVLGSKTSMQTVPVHCMVMYHVYAHCVLVLWLSNQGDVCPHVDFLWVKYCVQYLFIIAAYLIWKNLQGLIDLCVVIRDFIYLVHVTHFYF
jgi:hypothetical protein